MKVFGKLLKLVAALAAVAGVAYLVINYLDDIKSWLKKLCPCRSAEMHFADPAEEDFVQEPAAEEAPEEAPTEAAPAEVPAEPAAPEDGSPVAEEKDFEA